jgi:hypothetical protein
MSPVGTLLHAILGGPSGAGGDEVLLAAAEGDSRFDALTAGDSV